MAGVGNCGNVDEAVDVTWTFRVAVYSCYVMSCYLFSWDAMSCHVETCHLKSSYVVSSAVSLELAPCRKWCFVFGMPP